MSVPTRVLAAVAVLLAAAIPVGALTLGGGSSDDDFTIDIPTGALPAPRDDTAGAGPAATDVSQLVPQNAGTESDDLSAGAPSASASETPTQTSGLVSQNPALDALEVPEPATPAALTEASVEPEAVPASPARKPAQRRPRQAKKQDPAAGSWQLLFQGPSKK